MTGCIALTSNGFETWADWFPSRDDAVKWAGQLERGTRLTHLEEATEEAFRYMVGFFDVHPHPSRRQSLTIRKEG